MTSRKPETVQVGVLGGDLAVADWCADGPVVLALHGASSNSRYWQYLADSLPQHRVLAPDLRGRADSAELGGPFGLRQQAADAHALLEQQDLTGVTVVGHSLGAFIAPVLQQQAGSRIRRIVLVDGGLPVRLPWLMRPALVRRVFRREARRAQRSWPSLEAYVAGTRRRLLDAHPRELALTTEAMAHDLAPDEGCLPRGDASGIAHDAVDAFCGGALDEALAQLEVPTHLLYATHGRSDTARPFYRAEHVDGWEQRLPALSSTQVAGNHATILFSPLVTTCVAGASVDQPAGGDA